MLAKSIPVLPSLKKSDSLKKIGTNFNVIDLNSS